MLSTIGYTSEDDPDGSGGDNTLQTSCFTRSGRRADIEHGDMLCVTYAVKQKAPVMEALSVVTQVAKMTVTTVLQTAVVMEMMSSLAVY